MPYNEAQKRATMKYQKNNYEQIALRFRFGLRDRWKKAAEKAGMPLVAYIEETMEARIREEFPELSNGVNE